MKRGLIALFCSQRNDPPAHFLPHNALLFSIDAQEHVHLDLVYSRAQAYDVIKTCLVDVHSERIKADIARGDMAATSERKPVHIPHPGGFTLLHALKQSMHADEIPDLGFNIGIMTFFVGGLPGEYLDAICSIMHPDMRCEIHILYGRSQFRDLAVKNQAIVSDVERLDFLERIRAGGLPEDSDRSALCIDGASGLRLTVGLAVIRAIGALEG